MRKIERELNYVKYKAFGKVKIKHKKDDDKLSDLMKEKENITSIGKCTEEVDERICEELKAMERRDMEKDINKLHDMKRRKGNAAVAFNIKDRVLGSKKNSDEPTAVKNPITNEMTFEPKEIVKVCADYCENLLKNREPIDGFQEDLEMKRIIHNVRMKETIKNDVKFSEEMFLKTFNELKKKKEANMNSF